VDRVLRRWAPLAGVGLLLAAAWVAAALSTTQVSNLSVPVLESARPDDAGSAAPPPSPPSAPTADSGVAVPPWLTMLAAVLCTVVALAVVGTFLWYLVRDRIGMRRSAFVDGIAVRPAGTRTDVVAAVDAGLSDLSQADADPRRAIIACWVRLEQAAAAAGTPRRTSDSPTDLVIRLLDAHRVSAAVLDGFAAVYREARYTTHAMDEGTRQSAVAALRQLRVELSPVLVAEPPGRPS
jgi:hypothetical protein